MNVSRTKADKKVNLSFSSDSFVQEFNLLPGRKVALLVIIRHVFGGVVFQQPLSRRISGRLHAVWYLSGRMPEKANRLIRFQYREFFDGRRRCKSEN